MEADEGRSYLHFGILHVICFMLDKSGHETAQDQLRVLTTKSDLNHVRDIITECLETGFVGANRGPCCVKGVLQFTPGFPAKEYASSCIAIYASKTRKKKALANSLRSQHEEIELHLHEGPKTLIAYCTKVFVPVNWPEHRQFYHNTIGILMGPRIEYFQLEPVKSMQVQKCEPGDVCEGYKAIATERVPIGFQFGFFAGWQRPSVHLLPSNSYCMMTGENDLVIDGYKFSNEIMFVNDCRGSLRKPNVEFSAPVKVTTQSGQTIYKIPLAAIREIEPGEELLADYGVQYWNDFHPGKYCVDEARANFDRDLNLFIENRISVGEAYGLLEQDLVSFRRILLRTFFHFFVCVS